MHLPTASCNHRPETDISNESFMEGPFRHPSPRNVWGRFQLNAYRGPSTRWISFSPRLWLSMAQVPGPRTPPPTKKNNFQRPPATFQGSHIIRPKSGQRQGLETKRSASKIMKLIKKVSGGNKSNKLRNVTQGPFLSFCLFFILGPTKKKLPRGQRGELVANDQVQAKFNWDLFLSPGSLFLA